MVTVRFALTCRTSPDPDAFGFEIGDELGEVNVIAKVEADMPSSEDRLGSCSPEARPSRRRCPSAWSACLAILQGSITKLSELYKPHVETLRPVLRVGNA